MSPSEQWPAKWREKIRTSQEITHYLIDGRTLSRIRCGSESSDWHADEVPCHDSAVVQGRFHVPHCDVESTLSVVAKRLPTRASTVAIRR